MPTTNKKPYNQKVEDFALLLLNEIELRDANSDAKTRAKNPVIISNDNVDVRYRDLIAIFGDDEEIRKYLRYFEKKKMIKLDHILKQKSQEKQILENQYFSAKKYNNIIIFADDYFKFRRYTKYNFYPQDTFRFTVINQKNIENNTRKQFTEDVIEKSRVTKSKKVGSEKIDIFINDEHGIYRKIHGKIHPYPILINSKRYKTVRCLYRATTFVPASQLTSITGQGYQAISAAKNMINRIFRKKLKLKKDLIIHKKTGGYKLNREQYNIVLKLST